MVFIVPGIPIAILRMSEPYVLQEIKRIWYKLTCRKNVKVKSVKYSKESLDTFMNSSMNLELVAGILKGIEFKMVQAQLKFDTLPRNTSINEQPIFQSFYSTES